MIVKLNNSTITIENGLLTIKEYNETRRMEIFLIKKLDHINNINIQEQDSKKIPYIVCINHKYISGVLSGSCYDYFIGLSSKEEMELIKKIFMAILSGQRNNFNYEQFEIQKPTEEVKSNIVNFNNKED